MALLTVKDGGKTAELHIYDFIGEDFFGDGISARNVVRELNAAGPLERIEVRINSPGGVVADGNAIYNALVRHQARVVVNIDGHALSAASVIAMAGDDILMAENAMMMIHEAWGVTRGPAADHEASATVLRKLSEAAANVYAKRSGLGREELLKLMADETWFTADEAKDKGLCTEVVPAKSAPQACWDPKWSEFAHAAFRHTPDSVRKAPRAPARAPETKAESRAPQSSGRSALVPTALAKLAGERPRARLGDLVRKK